MSNRDRNDPSKALAARPTDYEVGFRKPPEATRFKPGQSGNPKGRLKGAKNRRPALHEERMKDIILDEADRTITVRDGDRNVSGPMAQAVIRSLAVNAAKGQQRAQRLFAELLVATERSRADFHDRFLASAIEYKVEWERELARRNSLGIRDLPPPLPHPDHVVVDIRAGSVHFAGPATKEEKAEWDRIPAEKESLEESVAALIEANKTETDPEEIEDNLKFIATGEQKLEKLKRLLPGP